MMDCATEKELRDRIADLARAFDDAKVRAANADERYERLLRSEFRIKTVEREHFAHTEVLEVVHTHTTPDGVVVTVR